MTVPSDRPTRSGDAWCGPYWDVLAGHRSTLSDPAVAERTGPQAEVDLDWLSSAAPLPMTST